MLDWLAALSPGFQGAVALAIGWIVALVIGGCGVHLFHSAQSQRMKKAWGPEETKPPRGGRVDPHVTGFIERLVFTAAVFARPDEAFTAMAAWLALKMAANWQRESDSKQLQRRNSFAVLALLSGLVSMSFAAVGGGLARYLACL